MWIWDQLSTDRVDKILQGYLPSELADLLDSEPRVKHKHRALILNMSCGACVIDDNARPSLLAR